MYVTIKKQGNDYTMYHRGIAKRVHLLTDNHDYSEMRTDGYHLYKTTGLERTDNIDAYRLSEPLYVREIHYENVRFNVWRSKTTGHNYARNEEGFVRLYRQNKNTRVWNNVNIDSLDIGAYEIRLDPERSIKREESGGRVVTTIFITERDRINKI